MRTKPRVLDLYCGAGGAGMGYHLAGFDVVGVDINPQPNYPFEFIQGDAIEVFKEIGVTFNLIHASPPCQGYSKGVRSSDSKWVPTKGKLEPKLIGATREAFSEEYYIPFVIENVLGAKKSLVWPQLLCGLSFGLDISRHRFFESSFHFSAPPHKGHKGIIKRNAERLGIEYRDMSVTGKGRHAGTSDRWKSLMGITWDMTQPEIIEAIPPVYTRYIGEQFKKVYMWQDSKPTKSENIGGGIST